MIVTNMITLKCTPKVEFKLKLILIKVCPHCGAENDLSGADAGPYIDAIPLCVNCEKPLWPTKGIFLALGVKEPGFREFNYDSKKKRSKRIDFETLCKLCDFIWGGRNEREY